MKTHRFALALTVVLAATAAGLGPGAAQGMHGRRRAKAVNTPANASAAVCRTRARDYAYDKHADPGQERLFFDRCMSGR